MPRHGSRWTHVQPGAHLGQAVQADLHLALLASREGHCAGQGAGQRHRLPLPKLVGLQPGLVQVQQGQPLIRLAIAQPLQGTRLGTQPMCVLHGVSWTCQGYAGPAALQSSGRHTCRSCRSATKRWQRRRPCRAACADEAPAGRAPVSASSARSLTACFACTTAAAIASERSGGVRRSPCAAPGKFAREVQRDWVAAWLHARASQQMQHADAGTHLQPGLHGRRGRAAVRGLQLLPQGAPLRGQHQRQRVAPGTLQAHLQLRLGLPACLAQQIQLPWRQLATCRRAFASS